ncbi:MAG: DUF2809 domain-containing protein [Chitinophagaceae bacterium]|nr:MAG: DUF2809 domain-containing protein [Chitinophagaceae bacterium]
MKTQSTIFRFHFKSLLIAIVLFIVEVLIALYVNDNFIRPYVGDVLVVILIYYFVKAFLHIPVWSLAIGTLIFSYIVECLQYFNFVKLIGMENNRLANIVIGNFFAWEDIGAYTIGITIVLVIEIYLLKHNSTTTNSYNE